jgi:hypothetical protein
MVQNLIDWALGTTIHTWVLSNAWAWPAMETLHFLVSVLCWVLW